MMHLLLGGAPGSSQSCLNGHNFNRSDVPGWLAVLGLGRAGAPVPVHVGVEALRRRPPWPWQPAVFSYGKHG